MNKQEFFEITGIKVNEKEWRDIEFIYLWVPMITIADIVRKIDNKGINSLEELKLYATEFQKLTYQINDLDVKIRDLLRNKNELTYKIVENIKERDGIDEKIYNIKEIMKAIIKGKK